jgi:hypothetical protein
VADVMVPVPSLIAVTAIVAVPEPLASAFVMAGTSFAGESGTVKVVVVLVPGDGDGDDGDEGVDSEHPTARTLRPTISADIRYMLAFLQESLRRISGRG